MRSLKVVVLAAALAGAGCTGTEAPAPGTFVVGVREPASLLPARVVDLPGRMLTGALWTPLTSHDPETHEVRSLAAATVTSPDQLVWTIRLRPGMRFHDGSEVTARSYVGAWKAALTEHWPGAAVLTDVLRAKDMRAVDGTTIELVLDRPFAQVPLVLGASALFPLPESVLASRDWAGFARAPVGNGPYRMAQPWHDGATLVRADGFQPGASGTAKEITIRVVDDAKAQYDQVRGGTLDLATAVPGADHEAMRSELAGRHVEWPLPEVTYLGFPLWDKRFQDPAIRHAITFAVDRAALEAGPLDRQVDPARSLLPPSVAIAQRSAQCRPCNHDPGAARSLLNQVAGLTGPVSIYHETGQEAWIRPLVEQLRRGLGLDFVARHIEAGRDPRTLDGPFVLARTLFSASPREPMTGIPGYTSASFAELLDSADAATNPAESGQLYRVAENQLLRDLPMAPLWSRHGHAVWSGRIRIGRTDPIRGIELAAVEFTG
jgi:oligopeptide transport system substrate-binding protein